MNTSSQNHDDAKFFNPGRQTQWQPKQPEDAKL